MGRKQDRKRKLTDFKERCRICLVQDAFMRDVNSFKHLTVNVEKCLSVKIIDHEELPRNICHVCLYKLEDWNKILKKYTESANELSKYFTIEAPQIETLENRNHILNGEISEKNQFVQEVLDEYPKKKGKVDTAIVSAQSINESQSCKSQDVTLNDKDDSFKLNSLPMEIDQNITEKQQLTNNLMDDTVQQENLSKSQNSYDLLKVDSDRSLNARNKDVKAKTMKKELRKRREEKIDALINASGENLTDTDSGGDNLKLSPLQKARAISISNKEGFEKKKSKAEEVKRALKNLETNLTDKYKSSDFFIEIFNNEDGRKVTRRHTIGDKTTTNNGVKNTANELSLDQNIGSKDDNLRVVEEPGQIVENCKKQFKPQKTSSELKVGDSSFIISTLLDYSDSTLTTGKLQSGNELIEALKLKSVDSVNNEIIQNCLKLEIDGLSAESLQKVQLEVANFVDNIMPMKLGENNQIEEVVDDPKKTFSTLDQQLKTIVERVLRANSNLVAPKAKTTVSAGFVKAAEESEIFQPTVVIHRLGTEDNSKTVNANDSDGEELSEVLPVPPKGNKEDNLNAIFDKLVRESEKNDSEFQNNIKDQYKKVINLDDDVDMSDDQRCNDNMDGEISSANENADNIKRHVQVTGNQKKSKVSKVKNTNCEALNMPALDTTSDKSNSGREVLPPSTITIEDDSADDNKVQNSVASKTSVKNPISAPYLQKNKENSLEGSRKPKQVTLKTQRIIKHDKMMNNTSLPSKMIVTNMSPQISKANSVSNVNAKLENNFSSTKISARTLESAKVTKTPSIITLKPKTEKPSYMSTMTTSTPISLNANKKSKELKTSTKVSKSLEQKGHQQTNKQRHICGICGDELFSKEDAEAHVKNHKSEADNVIIIDNPVNSKASTPQQKGKAKLMRCKRCHAVVEAQHVKVHVCFSVTFPCKICDLNFGSEKLLEDHSLLHIKSSKIKVRKESNNKPNVQKSALKTENMQNYSCFLCHKVVDSEDKMKEHLKIHCNDESDTAGNENYQCATCNEKFHTEQALEIHINKHTNEKDDETDLSPDDTKQDIKQSDANEINDMYKCQLCLELFDSSLDLAIHVQKHEEDAEQEDEDEELITTYNNEVVDVSDDIVCTVCDEIFDSVEELDEHSNVHEGKSHVCILCEKVFASILELRKHVSSHLESTGS